MKYVSTQWDPSTAPAMTLATNSLKMESDVQVKYYITKLTVLESTVRILYSRSSRPPVICESHLSAPTRCG